MPEDGAFDLLADERLFHEHLAVEGERSSERFANVLARTRLADTDRGAAVGWLHEARVADLKLDSAHRLGGRRACLLVLEDEVARLRDTGGCEDRAHQRLVHADRARRDAGADVRDVCHLQQALQRAVLAEGAMHDREYHVGVVERSQHLRPHERAVAFVVHWLVADVAAVAGFYLREAGARLIRRQPAATLRDAHGRHVEALRVGLAHHAACRGHGDLVLCGAPAEDHHQLLPSGGAGHSPPPSRARTIGPSSVMSPAPIVKNTSFGRRSAETRSVACSKEST